MGFKRYVRHQRHVLENASSGNPVLYQFVCQLIVKGKPVEDYIDVEANAVNHAAYQLQRLCRFTRWEKMGMTGSSSPIANNLESFSQENKVEQWISDAHYLKWRKKLYAELKKAAEVPLPEPVLGVDPGVDLHEPLKDCLSLIRTALLVDAYDQMWTFLRRDRLSDVAGTLIAVISGLSTFFWAYLIFVQPEKSGEEAVNYPALGVLAGSIALLLGASMNANFNGRRLKLLRMQDPIFLPRQTAILTTFRLVGIIWPVLACLNSPESAKQALPFASYLGHFMLLIYAVAAFSPWLNNSYNGAVGILDPMRARYQHTIVKQSAIDSVLGCFLRPGEAAQARRELAGRITLAIEQFQKASPAKRQRLAQLLFKPANVSHDHAVYIERLLGVILQESARPNNPRDPLDDGRNAYPDRAAVFDALAYQWPKTFTRWVFWGGRGSAPRGHFGVGDTGTAI